jgi:hypothetical protein
MIPQKLFYPIGCVALAFAVVYAQSPAVGDETNPPATPNNELALSFKDKIVLFEIDRSSALETDSGSVILHKVRITKLGNRDFIIGDGYSPEDSEDSWYKGLLVGVPCDSVIRFHAMTPNQFTEYMKLWKDRQEDE